MAVKHGYGSIANRNLIFALDAADGNSYPGSGTTWYDISGRGHNATLINAVPGDKVIVFDGTDDYADVNYSGANEADFYPDSFTLAAMAKQTSALNNDTWLFDQDYVGYRIWGGDNVPFMVRGPNAVWEVSSTYSFTVNQWYYVAATMIDDGSTGNVKVYINGELYSTHTFGVKNFAYISSAQTRFRIAAHWGSGNERPFHIGALHMYNKVLSADEVLRNYNHYKTRYS